MKKRTVHLISNSHLDPVWLWEWPEGLGEALSLARTVVDLCERDRTFVFNRGGAMVHRWIEQHDPELFERIRELVKAGQWNVMGGWYVQSDCNLPSGESFVRQILVGKRYFREKFGVDVSTGANLDSFGHTRGLVQILVKSGFDSYLFCRPSPEMCRLPASEFVWVGYDGSEILSTRVDTMYNSAPGDACRKAVQWLEASRDIELSVLMWGIGDHGGGPSRRDLVELRGLIRANPDVDIRHSTPQAYFAQLRRHYARLDRHAGDLNPWAVGCYTSMARVKHKHRLLENELFATEKMVTTAAAQGLLDYPRAELAEATRDLLGSEFHDALPGTSISPVEEGLLHTLGHGLETVSRIKTRAFFALAAGQRKAREDEYPILVYNPHPYPVRTIVECEVQPTWSYDPESPQVPLVDSPAGALPCQAEQQLSSILDEHRKRVVFAATLEPSHMNRFECRLKKVTKRPGMRLKPRGGVLRFKTGELEVVINARTGLIDRYRVNGRDCLGRDACRPIVKMDDADPWGMRVRRFRKQVGAFRLMSRAAGTRFSGVTGAALPSVRVIEDGPVRSVVEAVLAFGDSFICQRYKLPKVGTEIEIETRVHWNEKDRMLKLSIPTRVRTAEYRGQVAYGVADLPGDGDEAVAQKWVAVLSRRDDLALTCINDRIYGSDFKDGELRLSLLRGPAHSGHPTKPGRPIVAQDRYTPRVDQGEHVFRFWLNAGPAIERLACVDREASVHNEPPVALSLCPSGVGGKPQPGVVLSDGAVQLTVFKQAEDGKDLIIRLFEPTGRKRSTTVTLPFARARTRVTLGGFEIKTLRFKPRIRRFVEVDLLERPIARKRKDD